MDDHCRTAEVYRSFFSVARQLKRLAHQSAAEVGLTVHQLDILRLIRTVPGLTQKEVTERLRVPKSRVSLHIDALVEKEFAVRETSPQDRRETLLRPTPSGETLCEHYDREDLSRKALSRALRQFSPDEIELLMMMHERLLNDL
ncbi:DNA-binding transcriptional regulator, MarR family [Paenibacillus sophorae]|uniref:DNA-binding transcriptional regulator, MarR family n=1 Tax=Paenibacillus sophorae TaxID=1333845 RepID=A0A1H8ULU2_9BACL|nr:MarR family transcriptional regulator [Paenibacillus sophorae]QWU13287.1 MarR family transcriptional regulator [Paenibacillus sophorae]SEP03844.1 DNA-binding transcriptional regulator, MarR family [Paenibacillus sophorae]